MRRGFVLVVAALVISLTGCSRSSDKVVPAELVEFEASVDVQRVWKASLGGGNDGLRYGLAPVSNGVRIYAAAHGGQVSAYDTLTGDLQWRAETGLPLSAGPGLGTDQLALGTSEGEVLLLASNDGAELWRVNVGSEVLAAPAVSGERVIVRTVDGRMLGLDARDGSQAWVLDHRVQGLTLRGTSEPVVTGDIVISGFDDGQLAAVKLEDGEPVWESTLVEQRGRTALERLADIDGRVAIIGEDVFVTGYHGSTALLSLRTGSPVWRQEIPSYNDLALDWNRIYVSTSDDEVVALRRQTGAEEWRQNRMSNRQLSAPAIAGRYVAVGDFEGYLHWLDANDGQFVARVRAGDGPITAAPLVVGENVYVQTATGELMAFRVKTDAT